jgi:hypothetical protein
MLQITLFLVAIFLLIRGNTALSKGTFHSGYKQQRFIKPSYSQIFGIFWGICGVIALLSLPFAISSSEAFKVSLLIALMPVLLGDILITIMRLSKDV